MAVRPVGAVATEPVSLVEAKAHLRIDHTEEDTRISGLIAAAREYIERQTQKALATRTYRLTVDSFPSVSDLRLDRGPVVSITSVVYDDEEGIAQTLDPADYVLDNVNEPGWLIPVADSWPATISAVNAVRVDYVAGWAAGTFPEDLKQGILLLVGHWYNNREAVTGETMSEPPHSVHRIIHNHRAFL